MHHTSSPSPAGHRRSPHRRLTRPRLSTCRSAGARRPPTIGGATSPVALEPTAMESVLDPQVSARPTDFSALAATLTGAVLTPDADAYEAATGVWNLHYSARPAALSRSPTPTTSLARCASRASRVRDRGAQRRPQPGRPVDGRWRADHRSSRVARPAHRSGLAHRLGRRRPHRGRGHDRARRPWAGDPIRRHRQRGDLPG